MLRGIVVVFLALVAGCSAADDTLPVPTLMVLPGQLVNGQGEIVTLPPRETSAPATSPTPNAPNLGTLIATLSSRETRGGTFDDAAQSHVYQYNGLAGEYVNLAMARVSGAVDPVFTLYSPSGIPLATDDNSGGSPNAMLRNVRLPEAGLYSVQAGGKGFTGSYSITLTSSTDPAPITPTIVVLEPTPTPIDEVLDPTPIPAGKGTLRLRDHVTASGTLDREGAFARFQFSADDGEFVTICASPAPDSDLKLKLEVIGPAGNLVAETSSASGAGGDALVAPLEVLETGTYQIYVSAETDATGDYIVSYGQGWTCESVLRGVAPANEGNQGEITRRGLRDVWSVDLNGGDMIAVFVDSSDSLLDPYLEIAGYDGEIIASGGSSSSNQNAFIAQAHIPTTGRYHLRVQAAQGATVGTYSLIWRYVNLAPTSTPLPGFIPVLTVDAIAPDSAYLYYPFQGRAGQHVEIRVIAPEESGFDPVAALIGPDGSVIAEADDTDDTLNPRFEMVLPVDGTYNVRVNGYLKGGPFTLTVTEIVRG